jgi:superfamily I DNA/RNA helicase
MIHEYLADLNQQQRHAVKHGVKDGSSVRARPLLVIAGAGSGKTKTLAHRVAHLVVNGIDSHRILLLTFSRRPALGHRTSREAMPAHQGSATAHRRHLAA